MSDTPRTDELVRRLDDVCVSTAEGPMAEQVMRELCGDAASELARLRTELAACRRDAERTEIQLSVIRNWPEGFQARLQHVWLDVVSFIPNVKLYDLQRTLAEYGYTMKVYEPVPPDTAIAAEGEK